MAAPSWPFSRSVVLDNNGIVAPGALAYFFDAGTTTPRTTYQDDALSTPHPHPVVADANGRWPRVFLQFGGYAERVTTASGSQLWNDDGIDEPAPFDDTQAVDPNNLVSTGDTFWAPVDAVRAGAVRLNGRTIGNASSGGTERANADTSDLFVFLWNGLADGQAAVSSGRGASAAADYAANKTITLPNVRGGGPLGLDTMGNTAGSYFTGLTFDQGDATTPGSAVGSNTHVLTEAELAAHGHGLGSLATVTAGAKSNTIFEAGPNVLIQSGTGQLVAEPGINRSVATADNHVHTMTGTLDSTGSDTAHTNVSRKVLGTWYIKL